MVMRNRTVNAFLLAFALVFAVTAFWSATTNELGGDEAANVVAASEGSEVGAAEDEGQPLRALLQGAVQGGGEILRRRRQGEAHVREGHRPLRERAADARRG